MTKILKATSKGQITIPISWRKEFNTDQFIAEKIDGQIIIQPFFVEKVKTKTKKNDMTLREVIERENKDGHWGEAIFDADRDNDGKGIEAGEFLKLLRDEKI